jgi:hypothetical protein
VSCSSPIIALTAALTESMSSFEWRNMANNIDHDKAKMMATPCLIGFSQPKKRNGDKNQKSISVE